MKRIKREDGFTGIDISIAVIVIFIFTTIIAILSYQYNSSAKEIQKKSEATQIAITEIEKIKNANFTQYEGVYKTSTVDNAGNSLQEQAVTGKQGYYRTILVEDYTDIEGNENKVKDVVKRITVKISYKFKNAEQTVELSTIISKES